MKYPRCFRNADCFNKGKYYEKQKSRNDSISGIKGKWKLTLFTILGQSQRCVTYQRYSSTSNWSLFEWFNARQHNERLMKTQRIYPIYIFIYTVIASNTCTKHKDSPKNIIIQRVRSQSMQCMTAYNCIPDSNFAMARSAFAQITCPSLVENDSIITVW